MYEKIYFNNFHLEPYIFTILAENYLGHQKCHRVTNPVLSDKFKTSMVKYRFNPKNDNIDHPYILGALDMLRF